MWTGKWQPEECGGDRLAGGEDDRAQGQAQCLALHDTLEGVSSGVSSEHLLSCCGAVVEAVPVLCHKQGWGGHCQEQAKPGP